MFCAINSPNGCSATCTCMGRIGDMDHMAAKTSKHYSCLKSLFIFFQTSPEFYSHWTSQKYCFRFGNFELTGFHMFFSLTWNPSMRAKTSKCYFSRKSLLSFFQTSPEFSSQRSSQKYCFGFLIFHITIFYDFFSKLALSALCHIGKPETGRGKFWPLQ